MKFVLPSRLLSAALSADALVSGAVALLHVLAAGVLAQWLAMPHALLLGSGVFLLAYVVLLVVLARARRVPSALIVLVIAGNVLWALGCLALLLLGGNAAGNGLGAAFLLVHAATVLTFAVLEWRGLRRSAPAPERVGQPARA